MKIPSLCTGMMFLLACLAGGEAANAQQKFYAIADGNWSDPHTWSTQPGGTPGAAIPGERDTVVIAEGATARVVTVPVEYGARCASLNIGSLPRNSASGSVELMSASSSLTVRGDVTVMGAAEAATRGINVNAGTLSVDGNLSLGTGQTWTQNVPVCRIVVTDGTVNVAGDVRFNVPASGSSAQCQIVMSGGKGTFNLWGAFVAANNLGSLIAGTASTFNYAGTVPQTILITPDIRYNNLTVNNSSTAGATLGDDVTAATVGGALRVESGTLRDGGRRISGNSRGTFAIADGAMFVTSGSGGIATGFGTKSIAPASTVCYAGFDQEIAAEEYGNLVIVSGGIEQSSKTLPSAPLHVHGNLMIAPGNDITILVASADLTVDGNLTIGTGNWLMAGSHSLTIGGDFINHGTFAAAGGTVRLNGSVTQTVGGTNAPRFNNLVVASPEVTLASDVKVGGMLSMNGGNIVTGAKTLIIGDDTSATGAVEQTSGAVVGTVRRWVAAGAGDVIFPVGTATAYRPAQVVFTTPPSSGGTISASFVDADPAANGLPLNDGTVAVESVGREGFWSLTGDDGISGGIYDLELTAARFAGIGQPSSLRVLKRLDVYNGWELDGTHQDGSGGSASPVARRHGLYGFGDYSIGGDGNNPLSLGVAGVQAGDSSLVLQVGDLAPNPAYEEMRLSVVLGNAGTVAVDLVSAEGREIGTLVHNESYSAGEHQIPLSVKGLASGSYVLRVSTNGMLVTKRFVVMR